MSDRFRRDVIATLGDAATDFLALAVSGGPDSMAMLTLATAAFPGRVVAATVDHRLRIGSADEAAMVAVHCDRIGVPHTILTPAADWSPKTVQADARHLRYALLGDWACRSGAAALLTAHHADDQVETFLMRVARGSGVAGLGGIRTRWMWNRRRWTGDGGAIDDRLPVVRPLLGWRRSELAQVVATTNTPFATDPSNADDRFDRVRMRKRLVTIDWLDPVAIGRTASALSDADEALNWMTDRLSVQHLVLAPDVAAVRPADLPPELLRRLVERCLHHVEPTIDVRSAALTRLITTLRGGGRQTIGNVLCRPAARDDEEAAWAFMPAPPRRSP